MQYDLSENNHGIDTAKLVESIYYAGNHDSESGVPFSLDTIITDEYRQRSESATRMMFAAIPVTIDMLQHPYGEEVKHTKGFLFTDVTIGIEKCKKSGKFYQTGVTNARFHPAGHALFYMLPDEDGSLEEMFNKFSKEETFFENADRHHYVNLPLKNMDIFQTKAYDVTSLKDCIEGLAAKKYKEIKKNNFDMYLANPVSIFRGRVLSHMHIVRDQNYMDYSIRKNGQVEGDTRLFQGNYFHYKLKLLKVGLNVTKTEEVASRNWDNEPFVQYKTEEVLYNDLNSIFAFID